MLKRQELSDPNSCLNRAKDNEMIFVLLGRDPASPETIRFWIKERIRLGKNQLNDHQIVSANEVAEVMEKRDEEKIRRETIQTLASAINKISPEASRLIIDKWKLIRKEQDAALDEFLSVLRETK